MYKIWCNNANELDAALELLKLYEVKYAQDLINKKHTLHLPTAIYINKHNETVFNECKDLYNAHTDYEELIPINKPSFKIVIHDCADCPHHVEMCCAISGELIPEFGILESCNYLKPKKEQMKCCDNCAYEHPEGIDKCLNCVIGMDDVPTMWKDKHIYGRLK